MSAEKTDATIDLEAMERLDPEALDLGPKPRPDALEFLLTRRSTPAKTLDGPGPDERELRLMLRAAARAPDHGKLTPWRFLIIREAAQQRLAEAAERRARAEGLDDEAVEKARRGFLDGALIVAVISRPQPSEKIPQSEQLLSGAAVATALLNAALAMGFGANWLTGWLAYDAEFRRDALGLEPNEQVIGFIHMGRPRAAPPERPRPDLNGLISEL